MAEENMSQEFRLKHTDETRNYLIEEINRNELMSIKHKKICTTLNYIEYILIIAFTITGCVSISSFASLVDIPIGITSSAIELKVCAITAGIKRCKSIIKKKKKKWDRKVLSAKLNRVEVLISKVCFKVCYVFINHVLKEYNEMKEGIKN